MKWKENGVQTVKCITDSEVWAQDQTRASKQPNYRNVDGEHGGCMLNTDYK